MAEAFEGFRLQPTLNAVRATNKVRKIRFTPSVYTSTVDPLEANPLNRPLSELQAAALGCLKRGGVVVTGNARAARSLRQLHAEAQRAEGKRAWPTPLIHDWESWLSILWKQYLQNALDAPLLLTPLQERSVWKRIASASVADSEAIAKLAARAWELLSDFNAHGERNQSWSRSATSDAEIFRGWASTFHRECQTNRWISRSDLAALLTESIQQVTIDLPREILLVGFDRLTPAQQALIDAARAAGVVVNGPEAPQRPNESQLVKAKDLRDELVICAWWARRKLEKDSTVSIAIIVQGVEEIRGEIERIFREILMPESAGIEPNDAMPFEFSLGTPLAAVPLVKAALLTLRWLVEPLEQGAISWLAMSGLLAADGVELAAMAEFDAEVRKQGQLPPEVPLDAFIRYLPRLDSEIGRRLLNRLRDIQRAAQAEGVGNRRKTFPEWIDSAELLLKQVQWPGARTLESVEYQARARWERLTGEIAALGFDDGRVSWSEFVTVLDRYAMETIFAPESSGAPIQIMGTLESSGQEFDALWFLGVDERQWPATAQPNPLLPLRLQRKAGMPHSSFDADWALNLEITRRLIASAPECVFSQALRDETGDIRPSALLGEALGSPLSAVSSEQLRAILQVSEELPHHCLTEQIEDRSSIPWPKEIHAGGADILKRQSACAFQSFAVRRLGAEELGATERGLTPRDRGNIAHAVLQALWSKENAAEILIQSRDDLINAKATGRLEEMLSHHIADVFDREFGSAYRDSGWSSAYLQIEQARLRSVLGQWLDYEMKRVPFTVEEHEKDFLAQINGLQLNLRVDRIDRVDGGRLILDYKTGKISPAMWEGERPDEPQLPLYGVRGPVSDLRGVLFAQVRAGDMEFRGRVEDAAKTLSKDLDNRSALVNNPLTRDTLDEWAKALSDLAEQFMAGSAAVTPKQYPKTCRYCALPGLCRVAEALIAPDVEDDEEGDDIAESVANG
jgi:ATP-dependent helicase/nuclease subunit B